MDVMNRSAMEPRWILSVIMSLAITSSVFADEPDLPELDPQQVATVDASEEMTDIESQMLDAVAGSIGRLFFGNAGALGSVVELVVDALDEMEIEDPPMEADAFLEEIKPLMSIELGFVRLVCDDLTVEQRAMIRVAAEASLKQSADELRSASSTVPVLVVLKDQSPQPLSELRDAISNSLKQILSEDRFRQFVEISTARIAHRKQAAILGVVSRIDGFLLLNSEQREEIMLSLSTEWDSNWENWVSIFQFDEESLPTIPDEIVMKSLNDSQKSLWETIPKLDFDDWSDEEADMQFNDGWWGDVTPGAKPMENNEALEEILGS